MSFATPLPTPQRPQNALAHPDADRVLTDAFIAATAELGIAKALQAKIIGVSPATVTRLKQAYIKAASKPGELALLFLRMARSLIAYWGTDLTPAKQWLAGEHTALGGKPIELIQTAEGLVRVADYVDHIRGQ